MMPRPFRIEFVEVFYLVALHRDILGVVMLLIGCICSHGALAGGYMSDEQDVLMLAQEGDKNSQFQIGYALLSGRSEVRDEREALYWIKCASLKGHKKSLVLLSQFYRYGWGDVDVDLDISRRLLEQASEMGDGEAFFLTGVYYDLGLGVRKDVVKAQEYYK